MSIADYLRNNLKTWQKHSRRNIKPQFQDGKDKAGMQGEDFLRKLLVTHKHFGGFNNCLLLANKRVPIPMSHGGGGKREIDLILVSRKKIHIHEVKNWSGRLEGRIDDDIWTHYPKIGNPREVKNLTFDNIDKAKVLSQFLNEIGIDVNIDEIDYRTFFVDSKRPDGSIRLDISNKIRSDRSIVTTDKLGFYLDVEQADNVDQIDFWQKTIINFVEQIISFTLGKESGNRFIDGFFGRVGKENHKRLIQSLKILPTWDQLIFYGTKIQSGDVWGHYGFHKDWQEMFLSPENINFSKIEEIRNKKATKDPALDFKERATSLSKSLAMGFMPLNIKGRRILSPMRQLRGNPDCEITFQPAGKNEKVKVPIMEVDRIVYGNKYNNEKWLFNQI